MKTIQNLLRDESGATAVEYVAVTALASAGILAFFGTLESGLIGGNGAAQLVGEELDALIGSGGGGGTGGTGS
jgi:Flp pilus assembly pilin Flp